jgi:hypothetical protein
VDINGQPVRLLAEAPTFEALVKALQKDAQIVQARRSCHRAIALVRANTIEESRPAQPSPDTTRFFKAAGIVNAAPAQAVATNGAAKPAAKVKKPRKKRIPLKRARKKRTLA